MKDLTPMFRQYYQIKSEYEDCILMFRLGDFYEMFDEDAKTASRSLIRLLLPGIVEMGRFYGRCSHHAAVSYIGTLIKKDIK